MPPPRLVVPAAALVLSLALGACSDDEAGAPDSTAPGATTSVPETSTSRATAPASTSSTAPSTDATTGGTSGGEPATSTTIAYEPGEDCVLGTNPDCIDPGGTGQGVYLIGGAECMAAAEQNDAAPAICVDLDDDGRAGYPDRG